MSIDWQAWWNGIGALVGMIVLLTALWYGMVWALAAIRVQKAPRQNAATALVLLAAALLVGVVAGAF